MIRSPSRPTPAAKHAPTPVVKETPPPPTPPRQPDSPQAASSGTPSRASFINRRGGGGGLFKRSGGTPGRNQVTGQSRSRTGRPSLIGSTY